MVTASAIQPYEQLEIALISGLIGALISATLSYFVRARLDRKANTRAERQLAYVQLVDITQLLAAKQVVTTYVDTLFTDRIKQELKAHGTGTSFDLSHQLCAFIARKITELPPDSFKDSSTSNAILAFNAMAEGIKESKLSPEQLSRLPQSTVVEYKLFITALDHIRGCVLLWTSSLEHQDFKWVTAEQIHKQWRALTKLFESIGRLRAEFIRAGVCSPSEAASLMTRLTSTVARGLLEQILDRQKLVAAMADIDKEFSQETTA